MPTIINHPVSNLTGGTVQITLGTDRVGLGWKNDDGTEFKWLELLPDGAQDNIVLRRRGEVAGPGTSNGVTEIHVWSSDGATLFNP